MFTRHGLRFTPQARTEANNKPDFVFPGEWEYLDATFSATLLVKLGVKSTIKDRWRQALTEADLTPHPGPLHDRGGEGEAQRAGILSVAEFVEFVRRKQALHRSAAVSERPAAAGEKR